MPLFEYRCRPCNHEFEALVRNGATPQCPECGKVESEKLMSAASGRISGGSSLPITAPACPPSDAPPCSPTCCRL